jgi:site-specific DNA-methyltransferase (adenine-specific)
MELLLPYLDRATHGDCLAVLPKLPAGGVDLVVTDPPYLVRYRPRSRQTVHNDDNAEWLEPAFAQIARVLKPDSFCVSFYGWPEVDRFMGVWKRCGLRPVSHLVWTKGYASRRGYTESHHEVAYLLAKGRPKHPEHPPSDVLPWSYTGNLRHATEKPVSALLPLIEAYSPRGGIVLDPFAGSGSTGIAARMAGRRFILIEKEWHHHRQTAERLRQTGTIPSPHSSPAPGAAG